MKIVHLAIDDKFLNAFFIPNLKNFIGIKHHYFLIVCNGKPKFPILDINANVKYIQNHEVNIYLNELLPFEKLIIHGFTDPMRSGVLQLPNNINITIIVYGFELYQHLRKRVVLFQEQTLLFLNNNKSESVSILNRIKNFSLKTFVSSYRRQKFILKSFKRIDSIAHYLPNEYDLFKSHLKLKANYIDFNLGTLSQIINFDNNINSSIVKKNILIGNSGNATNNHLDVIEAIDNNQINSDVKVYCFLSYSISSNEYVEKVIEFGCKKFGKNFIPITKFISSEKYNNILFSCEKVILNHHRSQGGACVWNALYWGSDLFLSEKNPMFSFFTQKGAYIFKIENGLDLSKKLTKNQIIKNKKILIDNFSDDKVKERYLNLIN